MVVLNQLLLEKRQENEISRPKTNNSRITRHMHSGIHESRFFLSKFHASRTNFSAYRASRINPLPPSFYVSWPLFKLLKTFQEIVSLLSFLMASA